MKTIWICALYICLTGATLRAQDVSGRIQDIKKMYAEAQQLYKKGAKTCALKKFTEYDAFSIESEKIPFEQKAEYCTLARGYSLYIGHFSGYEWSSDYTFYVKDKKVFFVYISSGAEACAKEYRIYYDQEGNMIRLLEKSNDCDGNEPRNSKEVTDPEEQKRIQQDMEQSYQKLKKEMG